MSATRSRLRLQAPAKVNLSLEVTGRRTDGYHEIVSVMQTVGLYDDLVIERSRGIELASSDPTIDTPDNLVLRAARLLQHAAGIELGCSLRLYKRIPVAAGVGGGSSDAAATLIGLNELWSLGWPAERLAGLGAALGSDVPFFVYGGTAVVRGRGEIVEPLPAGASIWYTLVNPGVQVPTARIFSALSSDAWTNGAQTREVAKRIGSAGVFVLGPNGLQDALFSLYPVVKTCFDRLSNLAPGRTFVSGSGPTIVVASKTSDGAAEIQSQVRGEGWRSTIAPSVHQVCGAAGT
ncbi:MAG TPA: 4-(cytidine 5'-diphospho)-2-C-methyl-D-erythritol kinase [Chloroflexota bacterium]